ncbi:hypothetical protein ACXWTF_12990 [Thiomicrolovo sp. ZZH C-3]
MEAIHLINRAFKTPSKVLSIDVKIESDGRSREEAIFFKINHYKEDSDITMQLRCPDIRSLSYALADAVELKAAPQYKNFTESKGKTNELSIGYTGEGQQTGTFFLNIKQKNGKGKDAPVEKEVAFPLRRYTALAVIDTLRLVADETERALFRLKGGGNGY